MKEAKRLLAGTDMRIAEISQAVGYENEKHFMKLLRAAAVFLRANTGEIWDSPEMKVELD